MEKALQSCRETCETCSRIRIESTPREYLNGSAKTDRISAAQHALEQSGEASEKALYVVSALVSSNHEGQHQFHSNKGVSVIRSLLSKELSTRQHRKVLNLITDLTDVDGEVEVSRRLSHFSSLWR